MKKFLKHVIGIDVAQDELARAALVPDLGTLARRQPRMNSLYVLVSWVRI